jgi:hypothetical protein
MASALQQGPTLPVATQSFAKSRQSQMAPNDLHYMPMATGECDDENRCVAC